MEEAAWITRRHSRTRDLRRKRRDTEGGFPKFTAAVLYESVVLGLDENGSLWPM